MGDLSQHFSRSEFACHCRCGFGLGVWDVSQNLVAVLEQLRNRFDEPVIVMSGCRCAKHNRACGGARFSQHVQGRAADIKIGGVTPKAVADYLISAFPDRYGIGRYPTWTHIDVRPTKARWGAN